MFGYFDSMVRYFELSGRSSRTQYWMFNLVQLVVVGASIYADFKLSGRLPDQHHFGFFTLFVMFVHIVPSFSVTIRRLHDSGHSGWWYWISLVPVIGTIWFIVLMFARPDTSGDNYYGPDPRDGRPSAPRDTPRGKAAPKSRAQQLVASMDARRGGFKG